MDTTHDDDYPAPPAWHPQDTGPTGRPNMWRCYGPLCGATADAFNREAHDADFHRADKAPRYDQRHGCLDAHSAGECTRTCLAAAEEHLERRREVPAMPTPMAYVAMIDGTVWHFAPAAGPAAYERIAYRSHESGRAAKRILLHEPRVIEMGGALCLTGVRVGPEGDEIAPRGVDEVRHVIALALVTARTRMVMHRHYGLLVTEASQR